MWILIGVAAFAIWSMTVFGLGVAYESRQGKVATLEARVATQQTDFNVAKKLLVEEGVISEGIDAKDLKMTEVINAYRKKLAESQSPACVLTADDLASMRLGPKPGTD